MKNKKSLIRIGITLAFTTLTVITTGCIIVTNYYYCQREKTGKQTEKEIQKKDKVETPNTKSE